MRKTHKKVYIVKKWALKIEQEPVVLAPHVLSLPFVREKTLAKE